MRGAINGTSVHDVNGAMALLAAAGTEVALTLRARSMVRAEEERKGNKVVVLRRSTPTARLGITLGKASNFVFIDKVFTGFPATRLVQVGNRVVAINGTPVHTVNGAMRLLAAAGTKVEITIRRSP